VRPPIFASGLWYGSHRSDDRARPLADRHYNRQKIGAKGFAPPGRCLVFLADLPGDKPPGEGEPGALWITSYPFAEYVKHAWAGAWMCSCFRNEGVALSSELIMEAVFATSLIYGDPPEQGMVTFVDRDKTKKKRDPGRCYIKAGFEVCGETKAGLVALRLPPEKIWRAREYVETPVSYERGVLRYAQAAS
jgi:hypothetical protein